MKLYAIVNQGTNCVELDSSSLERAKQYCEELFKERPPGTVLHIYKYMLSAEKPSVVFRTNGVCKRTTVKRQRKPKSTPEENAGSDNKPQGFYPKKGGMGGRKKGCKYMPRWTSEEITKAISYGRAGMTYEQAAARMGNRTAAAIAKKMQELAKSSSTFNSPYTAPKGANSQ